MNIVFLSNYYNHHQSAFSESMFKLLEGQYTFIETSEMREERKKLGYGLDKPKFVKQAYNRADEFEACQNSVDSAEVVVFGSAPEEMMKTRQSNNKLSFRYSERLYKQGYQWYKWPLRLLSFYKKFGKYKNTYLLCSGAYTSADFAKQFSYVNKSYKWGYFPECKRYEDIDRLISSKNKTEILWCGRFLDWKHPDDVINIAKRLKDNRYSFHISFIGTGEIEEKLKKMIAEYQLEEYITILGSMKPEQVRQRMEQAGIYLFTSDRQEGWGAVLNESMNSGCAVVASHAIGAVPYLIKNEKNGLIYESGNIDELYERVKYLLDNRSEQERLGKAAYQTITDEWNSETAAKRLINLAQHILDGEKYPDLYKSGPCSRAEIIKDNWYKRK